VLQNEARARSLRGLSAAEEELPQKPLLLRHSITPILQYSNTPILHRCDAPSLHPFIVRRLRTF
jgi:hypothetical protein